MRADPAILPRSRTASSSAKVMQEQRAHHDVVVLRQRLVQGVEPEEADAGRPPVSRPRAAKSTAVGLMSQPSIRTSRPRRRASRARPIGTSPPPVARSRTRIGPAAMLSSQSGDRRPEDRRAETQAIDPPQAAERLRVRRASSPGWSMSSGVTGSPRRSMIARSDDAQGMRGGRHRSPVHPLGQQDHPVRDALGVGGDADAGTLEAGEQCIAIPRPVPATTRRPSPDRPSPEESVMANRRAL